MRILFRAELFWSCIGGVGLLAARLVGALRARGHELVVVTRRDAAGLPAEDEHDDVPVRRFPFWALPQARHTLPDLLAWSRPARGAATRSRRHRWKEKTMLPWQRRVGPNEQAVAARVIDGEAIIINLKTGVYYSTDNVGAMLWELVEQRRSLQEMVQAIVARYWVPREQAESDVQRLMAELIQEDLVSLSDGDGARAEPAAAVAPGRAGYDPPRLDIYRDMGDLLALDPPAPGFEQTPWEKDASR